MGLFNLEGGLMRSLSKFTDCICLSLLFLVSCIPVITIGTAAAALYHTVHKVLRHDRGYLFREYAESFRDNFKQTLPVWLIAMVIGAGLGVDLYVMNFYGRTGSAYAAFSIVFAVGFVVWFSWVSYLFPYMARFENTRKQSMKNAILMAILHLPMTILMLVAALFIGLTMYLVPFLILVLPAVYVWIQSFILERVFRKHMSEEDKKKEDEKYGK